jgi:hypothetical protein
VEVEESDTEVISGGNVERESENEVMVENQADEIDLDNLVENLVEEELLMENATTMRSGRISWPCDWA